MPGLELGDELVAHRLIREQIISLTREQSRHRYLIVLIRFDAELAAMMTIWDQCLVQLLNSERERQVFGVAVPDVADKSVKDAI